MKSTAGVLVGAAGFSLAQAASLADLCTPAHVKNTLPGRDGIGGLEIDVSFITTNAVLAGYDYCNVTLAYSQPVRDDQVLLRVWMPHPPFLKSFRIAGCRPVAAVTL